VCEQVQYKHGRQAEGIVATGETVKRQRGLKKARALPHPFLIKTAAPSRKP